MTLSSDKHIYIYILLKNFINTVVLLTIINYEAKLEQAHKIILKKYVTSLYVNGNNLIEYNLLIIINTVFACITFRR